MKSFSFQKDLFADDEPWQKESASQQRAADVSSAGPGFFCRQDAGSTLRGLHGLLAAHGDPEPAWRGAAVHGCEFGRRPAARTFVERDARRTRRRDACATGRLMKSLHPIFSAQRDNGPSAEVGRVTPCAPSFAQQESVLAGIGAQRTARPTFRFMQRSAVLNALCILVFLSLTFIVHGQERNDRSPWEQTVVTLDITRRNYDFQQPWITRMRNIQKNGIVIGDR